MLAGRARVAAPPAWDAAVVRAAIHSIDPAAATGGATAAAQSLSQEVLKAMFVQRLTIAAAVLLGAGLVAWAAGAAWVPRGGEDVEETPAAAPGVGAKADSPDVAGTFPVRGRVLDPDGKPVAGAEIFVRPNTLHGWSPSDPIPGGQRGRVATTDAEGRFRFDLDKGASDLPWGDDPAWHRAQITAAAPGFGPAWVEPRELLKGEEAVLKLVRDDVPIRGRVVDPQGRPIAGVTVQLQRVAGFRDGADLDAVLASGEVDGAASAWWYAAFDGANWPGGRLTWTTDAEGRFEIQGIGRDRVATLAFSGPKLANSLLRAMTRPAKAPPKPRPKPSRTNRDMMFIGSPPSPPLVGATFEHVTGPSKPIVGVVRSQADGKPVEGMRVFAMEGATWTGASARTDAQGRFRIDGLPKGEVYRVSVNEGYGAGSPYLSTQMNNVTDTEGLKPIELTIDLPKGVEITGRLIDPATGRPVPYGQITYVTLPTNPNKGGTVQDAPSATDPTFRLTVPPGGGFLMVQARGKDLPYMTARLRKADKGKGVGGLGDGETTMVLLNAHHAYKIIDVPADAKSMDVDLELTRGFARKGKVVDADGKAVEGVQCYGLASNWGVMKTLADGTFEVLGLERDRPRQLIFAHKGRRLVGSTIIKGEDSASEAPLVVTLGPPAAIAGRLVDEDGLPIAGASLGTLTITIDGDNLPPEGPDSMWPDGETVTSGADGRFRIDGLKPGVRTNHGVSFANRPGYWGDTGKALRDIVVSKAGEVRDLGDIKVKVVRQ
jgi:hypothetical protein